MSARSGTPSRDSAEECCCCITIVQEAGKTNGVRRAVKSTRKRSQSRGTVNKERRKP